MIRFLKKLPIRSQLLILASITTAVMIMIIFMIYFQVAKVIAKNNNEYTNEMFFQIKQSISNDCDLINRVLMNVAYNNTIQNYLIETDLLAKYEEGRQIRNLFFNFQEINNGIVDFAFVGENGEAYFMSGSNEDAKGILDKVPSEEIDYYTEKVNIENGLYNRDCFVVTTPIYSIYSSSISGKKIGLAAVILDTKVLGLEINKRFKASTTKFYLLDRNGIVYSSNEISTVGRKFDLLDQKAVLKAGSSILDINGKRCSVTVDDIPHIKGKIISVVPEEELLVEALAIRKLALIVFIFALALLSIPFSIIINNILHPLRKFMKFMSLVKSGNLKGLKERINLEGYAEVETMAGEFNSLLDEIDNLTRRLINTSSRLYEAELQKKQSELAYLKSEINPHFLYNTLESMKGIAVEENAYKTLIMAKALGQIFRYSVKGADIVTLNDELSIIKSYLKIQQMRFAGRFEVEFEFSEDALRCSIPKMIFQPIVENAIYHGLETNLETGHLCIGGEIYADGHVCIWVKDDGVGMDSAKLECIRGHLSHERYFSMSSDDMNDNIGLANVNNRIKLTYGEKYGLEINSALGQGTEVILRIPAGGIADVQCTSGR